MSFQSQTVNGTPDPYFSRPLKNVQFWSRSRKAKISTTGIYRIFRGLKFEPDAEIGQISTDFERGRFSKVSSHVVLAFYRFLITTANSLFLGSKGEPATSE